MFTTASFKCLQSYILTVSIKYLLSINFNIYKEIINVYKGIIKMFVLFMYQYVLNIKWFNRLKSFHILV